MGGVIASLFIAFFIITGWVFARTSIETDCQKIGKFYVGSTVYECKPTKESTP